MNDLIKKQKDKLNLLIMVSLFITLILISFIIDTPNEILQGLYRIILHPDMLLTDYLAVGGVGATLVNVGFVALIIVGMIYILKIPLTGPLIASVITVSGFSFIGKNFINIWPILIGTFLYARYQKIPYRDIAVTSFFITTLAPAVSEIAFGLELDYLISVPLALFTGIGIGFITVPLANHMYQFHNGYNLYNIGFVGGIIGTLITSLLRGFGLMIEPQSNLSTQYSAPIRNVLIFIFLFYILLGFVINKKSFKGYKNILEHSGPGLADFVKKFGFGLTYVNIGIMGLISVLYVIIAKGTFNGPIIAGILTVVAFATSGKTPKNSVPILIGVYLAASLKIFNVSDTSIIIAALFGTTLAPITGTYGVFAGIIAGFLHVSIVSNVVMIHGGLNLYNNGFSGGIVAAIMVPLIESFQRTPPNPYVEAITLMVPMDFSCNPDDINH